jgi:hypothetical protein
MELHVMMDTLEGFSGDADQKLNSDFDDSFNNILSLSLNGVEKDDPEVGDKNHLTYSDEHGTEYFNNFKQNSDATEFYFYHLVFDKLLN